MSAPETSMTHDGPSDDYDRKAMARSSAPLAARLDGIDVYLRAPLPSDARRFCELMLASRRLHRTWVQPPLSSTEFAGYLKRTQDQDFVGLLVCRKEDDDIAGVYNLSQIVRGALQSAYLGYYACALHAGRGYMRQGMQLALRYAFRELRLHRVEANIRPNNHASRALAQAAGFRLEGFSPRYLKIGGRWRDHERWALLAGEWRPRR
jgi:ribosomal-protein-alanine N-acetyltransferase